MKYDWPAGIILFVPSGSAVPDGFTRVSAADGKFIRHNSTAGGSGSGSSHSHTLDPDAVWSGLTAIGTSRMQYQSDVPVIPYSHRHTINRPETTSSSDSSLPSYLDVLIIKKT